MKAWLFAKEKHDIFQTNEPWILYGGGKEKYKKNQSPETGLSIFN